jgi:hypothetical protein
MLGALIVFVMILSWTGYWLILKGQLPVSDRVLMLLGTFLLVSSVLIPFLIIMKVLPSTFFLNFLSYEFILLGMMFFVFGIGGMGRSRIPNVGEAGLREYALGLQRLRKRSELNPTN